MKKTLFFWFVFCICASCFSEDIDIEGLSYPAEWERQNKTYIIDGELSHLQFYFKGKKGQIKDPCLIIELSEGVSIASAFHCPNFKKAVPLKGKISRLNSFGSRKTVNEWKIPLNEDLINAKMRDDYSCGDETALLIFLEASKNAPDKSSVKWHLQSNGKDGKVKELSLIRLSSLPKDPSPEKIKFLLYDTTLFACPRDKTWQKIFSLYKKVGFKGGITRSPNRRKTDEKLSSLGWEMYADTHGWGAWGGGFWGVYSADQISKDPESILHVLKDGTRSKNHRSICQTYLIENSGEESVYFKKARDFLLKWNYLGLGGYVNDYEIWPWTNECSPLNSCFCPRCIKAFARYSNLPEDKLTPKTILSKHKKEWLAFRFEQNAQMMDIFSRVVHSIDPKLKASVSSAPAYKNKMRYPIDIELFDKWIDEHQPQFYGKGTKFYRELEFNRGVLKKRLIATINCGFPIGEHKPLSAEDLKLNILTAAATGCEGIAFFTGSISLDGKYLTAVQEAGAAIARLENFFMEGKRIDKSLEIEGLPEKKITILISGKKKTIKTPSWDNALFYKAYSLGGDVLVAVFNYHPDKSAFIKMRALKLSGGKYFLSESVSKTLLVPSAQKDEWRSESLKDGVLLNVPARSAAFWLLSSKKPSVRSKLNEEKIKKDYDALRRKFEKISLLKPAVKENSSAPRLQQCVLKTKSQELAIDREGGRVWSWKVEGNELCDHDLNHNDLGGLCVDRLWTPHMIELEKNEYEIVSRANTEKEMEITLAYDCDAKKMKDLSIQKTYKVSQTDSSFSVNYKLENKGKEPLTFSFWIHNTPSLGNYYRGLSGSNEKGIDMLVFEKKNGLSLVAGDSQDSAEIFFNSNHALMDKSVQLGAREISDSKFAQFCPLTEEALIVETEFEDLLQIYWCRIPASTLEWMYKTVIIKPEQSWRTSFKLTYAKGLTRETVKNTLQDL